MKKSLPNTDDLTETTFRSKQTTLKAVEFAKIYYMNLTKSQYAKLEDTELHQTLEKAGAIEVDLIDSELIFSCKPDKLMPILKTIADILE